MPVDFERVIGVNAGVQAAVSAKEIRTRFGEDREITNLGVYSFCRDGVRERPTLVRSGQLKLAITSAGLPSKRARASHAYKRGFKFKGALDAVSCQIPRLTRCHR